MTIHAADKNMRMENVIINYKDRPEGSVSKLNTSSDGIKVLKTIFNLFSTYKPMHFFGSLSAGGQFSHLYLHYQFLRSV